MDLQELSMSGFIKEFKRVTGGRHPRKFCFVLGAGSSISSGIRSGQQLVAAWDAELLDRNRAQHLKWKESMGITDANRAEFYSQYYERMFPIPMDGYSYMEREMEAASPSAGYAALAYLLCNTRHNIVLTTNFDHLAEDAVNQHQQVFPLVIGHEALAHYIVDDAERPIVIKIHRDLLMDPKSREKELDSLDDNWRKHLDTVFSGYYPVFIGYAGNDRSLMDYLMENVDKVRSGQWKLPYWTIYGNGPLRGKSREFMEAAGGYWIPHCDFDRLMICLGDALDFKLKSLDDIVEEAKKRHESIRKKIEEVLTKPVIPDNSDSLTEAGSAPEKGQGKKPVKPSPKGSGEAENQKEESGLNEAISRITGDTDPNSPSARHRQARLAYNSGDFAKAEEALRQLVKEYPDNAAYHFLLSATLFKMDKLEHARVEAERAIRLEPENAAYHNILGVTLYLLDKNEEARPVMERAVELDPENPSYHHGLGTVLHGLGKYELALAEKRRAAELDPENALYHSGVGVTLHEKKEYEQAMAEKQRAVELDPDNARFHYSLAITLFELKLYERAIAEYQRAVELNPEKASYHYFLGVSLYMRNKREDALPELKRAVELEPENAVYRRRLELLEQEMKEKP